MHRFACGVLVALLSVVASAQEPIAAPKPQIGTLVREDWQAACIDGVPSGYVQFTVHQLESNGMKFLRASRKLALTLKRFGDLARVEAVTGTDETPDGRVLGVFMRQGLGKEVNLTVRGVVTGNQLNVTAEGKMQFNKTIPWDAAVVGSLGEMNQIGKMKPEPGRQFSYMIYEPIINSLVTVQATAQAYEEVVIGGKKYNLLKIVAKPQPVQGVTLPASTFWYDANYEMIKSETIMPGLGRLTLDRTSREIALVPPGNPPDLGWRQSIQLQQRLATPHDSAAVVYRLKLKDSDPLTVFALDERQTVKLAGDKAIELTIQAVRTPPESAGADKPSADFLNPNNFINCDDDLVRRHAMAAVGKETDPWQKAKAVERWVHNNMRVLNFTEAMAPASQVAKDLQGDCTEYSMLTAAMCRAVGVPSRTALGLVYVPGQDARPPVFAMHMWTEVWVNGKWLGLDATLGRGSIGPAHIKVTDHSWAGVATMTPLMPLMRVMMSEPVVEIVSEQRTR